MSVLVFYRDIYGETGVPAEIKSFSTALSNVVDVCVAGKAHGNEGISGVQEIKYSNIFELYKKIREEISANKPEILVLVGVYLPVNILVCILARMAGINVILNPLVQISNEVTKAKLFIEDPDVKVLEKGMVSRAGLIKRIYWKANPFIKKVYLATAGRLLVKLSTKIAVFSEFEKSEIKKFYTVSDEKFIKLIWGCDSVQMEQGENYYDEAHGLDYEVIKMVYWGRIDWYYKGIDRLLKSINWINQNHHKEYNFKVYLIGPDYRNSIIKVEEYVSNNGLKEIVDIVKPGDYKSGSKKPLADADLSLYLSRWDGFPRTLRESIHYGVPVLVSSETHFCDYIHKYSCGICVENADDEELLAKSLIEMMSVDKRSSFSSKETQSIDAISWERIARDFYHDAIA